MIKNKYVKIAVVVVIVLAISGIFVYKKFFYKEKEDIKIAEESVPKIATFINFVADGCKPCERMEVLMQELIEEYDGIVEIKELDVYENINLATKYGINSTPTQVFFDEKGNIVTGHTGFLSKSKIKEILAKSGVEK